MFFRKTEQVIDFPQKLEPLYCLIKSPDKVPEGNRILMSTIVLVKSFILDRYDGEILRNWVKLGQMHLGQAPISIGTPVLSPPVFLCFPHLRPGPSFSAASPSGQRRSPAVHDSTTQTPQRSEGSGANLLGPAPGAKSWATSLDKGWCPAVISKVVYNLDKHH